MIAAVGFAFAAVLAISQIYIFATGLILLSAGSLARLDIQTAGYTERQAFWILTATSLIGTNRRLAHALLSRSARLLKRLSSGHWRNWHKRSQQGGEP
uniref:Uncharacterized protein n=1 Tax=Desertifilum tharense IPPAS B-1220 TaxID=1781255 RepID=A0ACD5GPQ5_9CYAN